MKARSQGPDVRVPERQGQDPGVRLFLSLPGSASDRLGQVPRIPLRKNQSLPLRKYSLQSHPFDPSPSSVFPPVWFFS